MTLDANADRLEAQAGSDAVKLDVDGDADTLACVDGLGGSNVLAEGAGLLQVLRLVDLPVCQIDLNGIHIGGLGGKVDGDALESVAAGGRVGESVVDPACELAWAGGADVGRTPIGRDGEGGVGVLDGGEAVLSDVVGHFGRCLVVVVF